MSSEIKKQDAATVEMARRQRSVRQWIYLRAVLLGVLVAGWWILFVPDSMVGSELRIALGIGAGLVATGSYLFNLRKTLYPEQ